MDAAMADRRRPDRGRDPVDVGVCALGGELQLRGALAHWLSERFSTLDVYLVTWTFAAEPTYSRALRGAAWLERRLRRKTISSYTTVERGSLRERLHLHTLTDDPLTKIQAEWQEGHGFTSTRGPVDSKTAAAMYVTKYTTKSRSMRDMPVLAFGARFYGQTQVLNG